MHRVRVLLALAALALGRGRAGAPPASRANTRQKTRPAANDRLVSRLGATMPQTDIHIYVKFLILFCLRGVNKKEIKDETVCRGGLAVSSGLSSRHPDISSECRAPKYKARSGKVALMDILCGTGWWRIKNRAKFKALGTDALAPREYASASTQVFTWTTGGWAGGLRRPALDALHYYSFRGIPYARQPTGSLRFQEPQPLEPWEGVWDAREEGPACPQHDVLYGPLLRARSFSEACLYANVHVPDAAADTTAEGVLNCAGDPRPMLVFVHGGGFAMGSGDADLHGPEPLVAQGVVVVTFNYRLGPFGFLSLKGAGATLGPANVGLRDALALLRWVRANAAAFCADAGRVTLGGHSAGSAIVHLLLLSDSAHGLFHKAIMMSGAAARSFYSSSPANADRISKKLLEQLGISGLPARRLAEELRIAPVERLVEATRRLQDQEGFVTFVPVVEAGAAPVVPSDPETSAMNVTAGAHVPVLIGFTAAEGNTFRRRFQELQIVNVTSANALAMVPLSLLFRLPPEKATAAAAALTRRYYYAAPSLDGLVQFTSDAYFVYPALKAAQWAAARGGPVYLYRFSYESEARVLQAAAGLDWTGAGHVQDLLSVFRTNAFPEAEPPPDSADAWMRNLMVRLFGDFIATREPATGWPAVEAGAGVNGICFLDIDTPQPQPRALSPDQREMLQFYDRLYDLASVK
ncbi:Juvenile hormone esterase [Eumeta japonica]|uniref:Juvenile hormone esterase n=1 Tax=Eumeta variegata TaxID=151549 RepID=A0A4C1X810_EUMVA|nr:Juvenile hormone esterase [Eumeta japonica]